jgi:hypothetical protein
LPGKTNTELIHELREAVAALGVRANAMEVAVADIKEDIKDQRERLIKSEVKLEHLEKQRGEEHGRAWAIKLAILSHRSAAGSRS